MGFKLFADNNFDEPSEVLNDSNSAFMTMEMNVQINSGKVDLNIFKMNKEFVGENREEISKELPGYHGANNYIEKK
jgi:hypothetical protein